jgi:spermidine/putrescine transport system substrate-binding protein
MRNRQRTSRKASVIVTVAAALIAILITSSGCGAGPVPAPSLIHQALPEELVFYDWEEDMPQSVLDAFSEAYGIQVSYRIYDSQDEALGNIRDGEAYDVVVVDNDYIPQLVADGLLAEIDYQNVPNFKNISANFRDLAYDPGNKHTIPFNWGTTGMLVRSDLVEAPVTRWADLWQLQLAGKIGMRAEMRDLVGPALKALGYSANSENPQELGAALDHLLEIRQQIVIVDSYAEAAVPLLTSGEVVAMVGWADDALQAREANQAITYVLPEEGAMVWGDNFVIPANSPHKYTAEVFLNFLLRPEISAQIVDENYYATANEAAHAFIDPKILNDPVIFPSNDVLKTAEIYLPLSPQAEEFYQQIFERFMASLP